MKFTIDRRKWLRGEGVTKSQLLRPFDEKMCCMGQVAEQCGVEREDLVRLKGLGSLLADDCRRLGDIMDMEGHPKDWVFEAYAVNDTPILDDATREQKLSALFAENGCEVEFVG